jgi:hypothetical protein
VDTLSSIDGHHSAYPHAEFDVAGDTLAIVWRDSVGGTKQWDIYGVVSTNGGQTWSNPDTLISTNDADWDPDLLVDNQGRFHLAYHVYPAGNAFWGARVEYRYSDNLGSTWMTPTNPSSGQISEPGKRSQLVECFRYDAIRNVLWFSWKDERDFNTSTGDAQGDLMITYSTDRGLTWSTPEFATDLHDSTTGFKAGTLLPNGDYCLNYEVIPPGNTTGYLRVYFRKRKSVISKVEELNSHIPNPFQLDQNCPNPFNSTTTIRFSLPHREHVTLNVYDVLGREVATLVDGELTAGEHTVNFNAEGIPSGVYFTQMKAGNVVQRIKMMVTK